MTGYFGSYSYGPSGSYGPPSGDPKNEGKNFREGGRKHKMPFRFKQNGARFNLWLFIKSCLFRLLVIVIFVNLAAFYYFLITASMENEKSRQSRDNKIDSVLEKLAEDKGCGQ